MTAFNEMVLDTNAFLADTIPMSTLEKGAYLLILIAMHRSPDGWIAGDDCSLGKISGLTRNHWHRIAPLIRGFLIVGAGGKVSQNRIQRDRASHSKGENASLSKGRNPGGTPLADKESLLPLETHLVSESSSESVVRANARKTLLHQNWGPDGKNITYAVDHGFNLERVHQLADAFADHHRSHGNRMADWDAAWRTWVRNEVKFSQRRGGGNGVGKSVTDAWDRLRGNVERSAGDVGGQGNLLRLPQR
jgi:uncharacterized protein YdaU (DUF1376 family)